jgi:flagellar hook-basal body complex protein FliE
MDDMFITPINLTQGVGGTRSISDVFGVKGNFWNQEKVDEENTSLFGSIFGDMINNVRELEDDYMKKQYLLSTGQLDDPHTVPIAGSELQLSVDLLVQMRNKALEAYNSLITISM